MLFVFKHTIFIYKVYLFLVMGEKEIPVTYETLFDLLRREKNAEELQKLDRNILANIVGYLRDKQNMLAAPQSQLLHEREKTEHQLKNIRRIIKEIYDRRETKIINMAINKARTQSNIINTEALLEHEKKLYEEFNSVLDAFRKSILNNVVTAKLPESITETKELKKSSAGQLEGREKPLDIKKDVSDIQSEEKEEKNRTIRFLSPIPRFVGPNLETYGPFEEDEITTLPERIAHVLIEKNRAEMIEGE